MHGEKFASIRTDGDSDADTPRVVSVKKAQALLGDVTYRQIGLMVQRGELRSGKVGRRRVIELASINEYLDAHMEPSGTDNKNGTVAAA
jgi:hypothetical protein